MIRNYLKVALRNLYKKKLYTIINAFGLALGLSISFIIYSWVTNELSYDQFHKDYKNIYRLIEADESGSGYASISPAAKTALLEKIPEVEYSIRIFKSGFLGGKTKVAYGNKVFTNDNIYYTDPEFFQIFSFQILEGNPESILDKPNAVVITEKTAKKYFGDEDPLGKTLILSDRKQLEVTGILKNLSKQSHFHFDLLVSMGSHPWGDISKIDMGSAYVFHTYLKVYPDASLPVILNKFNKLIYEVVSEDYASDLINVFKLQPLADIHLKSDLRMELEANNDMKYIYLFSTIALLVIFIAGINYINLATAYSFDRAKEVGVRKVLGALKKQLMFQYLSESLIISFIALILAIFLIELLQPLLTSLSDIGDIRIYQNVSLFLVLIVLTVLIGLIAGFFPSLILSSLHPIQSLKSNFNKTDRRGGMRKVLVIFQFSISILLILSTVIIYQQLQFLQKKKLGYTKDHVLILHIGYPDLKNKHDVLKNAILSDERIINATAVSQLPANIITGEYIDTPDGEKYGVFFISIDNDFFNTLDVPVIIGEDRIGSLTPEQYQNKFVLNQTALKEIGWKNEEAIDKKIVIRHGNMQPGPIIGIVEDFNFQSLHHSLGPLVFEFVPESYEYLLVKVKADNIPLTIDYIQSQWHNIAGDIPFDYSFLDSEYDSLYKAEMQTGKLFIVFAIIATLIAMLGLFGLSSYAAFKRTKEMGIRKVFGASGLSIIKLLSKDFTLLVVLAFVITTPIAYYFMKKWLQAFAYRTEIHPLYIILPGCFVLVLALITVGYHSMKAAGTNPVKTLRYE